MCVRIYLQVPSWVPCILLLLPRLPLDTLEEVLLKFTLRKGGLSASLTARYVCAELIGPLSLLLRKQDDKLALIDIGSSIYVYIYIYPS